MYVHTASLDDLLNVCRECYRDPSLKLGKVAAERDEMTCDFCERDCEAVAAAVEAGITRKAATDAE